MGDSVKKEQYEFGSYLDAFAYVSDRFLSSISLLSFEGTIAANRLEVYFNLGPKGVVNGYTFFGKIRFLDKVIVDEDDPGDDDDSWKLISHYELFMKRNSSRKKPGNLEKAANSQKLDEVWVLSSAKKE
jgi:hypothetical protein